MKHRERFYHMIKIYLVVFGVILIGLGFTQHAGASEITYDFTGTLQASLNGSNQFSGSFTINGDPTLTGFPQSVTESGSDVSLTVNLGNATYTFFNQQQTGFGPVFAAGPSPTMTSGPAQDVVTIFADTPTGSPDVTFAASFLSSAALDQLTNLRDLSFPLDMSDVYITTTSGGPYFESTGSFTSVELVTTPEPSLFGMFAFFGMALIARHRYRR